MDQVNQLVRFYFHLGFSHKEIVFCLQQCHGVHLSLTTVRRRLKGMALYRRRKSDLLEVALFVMEELERHGQLHGYKTMHLKCIQKSLQVTQETVRILLQLLDPEGVAYRRSKRLRRRLYRNPGPNYMWHIDSYDKLKPYGICINAAIDGFSRNIIWIKAYWTNSNPRIIAGYFMEEVEKLGGCPARVRCDMGTENVYLEQMQRFLRYDHVDEFARDCFIYGSSNHNQRIESWWSYLRKQHAQFWMNLFQQLKEENEFSGDLLDKSLVQFCFMNIIQNELNEVADLWNMHRMRRCRNAIAPNGRPLLMYNLPNQFGGTDHLQNVSRQQVRLCKDECTFRGRLPCDETVFEIACTIMAEHNISPPEDTKEAEEIYKILRRYIRLRL
ncbi:hypothetical protein HOLleu_18876 [Holothuria leucospilota]|uniref:Integrase core domain-containing protein n=1 Tax=Holothuria leucospilota TaxID=206669 RepID=A0A9Q1C3G1_HOLLE|nr:hypothetical protein HOLleu_18876 [Holothuria leucospilota]